MSRSATPPVAAQPSRLDWLTAAIAAAEQHERRFRRPGEEAELSLMAHPLAPARAYALFGLLLGTLPSAALVLKVAWLSLALESNLARLFFVIVFGVSLTFICALIGRSMGRRLAPALERAAQQSWPATILAALAAGFVWACATGMAGGGVVFLVGALYGLVCALPSGLAGFLVFTVCHRLLARGGMIDARHFWPVACGIALSCAALILSPGLLPDWLMRG